MTVVSPSECLWVTLSVPSAVRVTVNHCPDTGSWIVSPSWISTSGTCSVASSELIILLRCRCEWLPYDGLPRPPQGLSRYRAPVNPQMLSWVLPGSLLPDHRP